MANWQPPQQPQGPQGPPWQSQPQMPPWMQQQPPTQYQQPPMAPQGYPPMMQPTPKKKPWYRRPWGIALIIVGALFLISSVNAAITHGAGVIPDTTASSSTPTTVGATVAPTSRPAPTTQVVHYPPKTVADLHGLAAQGDASAIHEFHSETVGLAGICPRPRREVTVSPNVTGQQLAKDLLAYYYAQQLENPCGSIVFAYHTQTEVDDPNTGGGYTAGRVWLNVTNANGDINTDPNAANLVYTLTLDLGGDIAPTLQEYVVKY